MSVREELFKLKDEKYRTFNIGLLPTVDEKTVIGVRIPELRKLAKKLQNNDFPWEYYEEILLHGIYIGTKNIPYEVRLKMIDEYVLHIDNWATCDCACSSMKFILHHKKEFLSYLEKYMHSEKEFCLRFACVILMSYYIDDEYVDFVIDYYKNLRTDYYYVKMAVAWGLSVAFVKYQEKVMPLLISKRLSSDIQNMTISKIRDSYRVSAETKQYVKTLRA